VEKIKETPKTILTGDFNTRPQTKTIQAIEAHLNNLFSDKLTTTFNLPRKDVEKHPGYATATVDMMFVSFDIGIIDTYCPRVDVSDHLPLVANLRV
jgi:endonuclease/exonuclease/phosphatase family metal-dependent hydrolase